MTLMGLLIALRARRVRLDVDGDRLLVDAPKGAIDSDLCLDIQDHKMALLTLPRPYINERGELISPCNSPPQYHWQPMAQTLRELHASKDVWERHTSIAYTDGE